MGPRLVSWRAVSASVALSVSVAAAIIVIFMWGDFIRGDIILPAIGTVVVLVFFGVAVLQVRMPRWWPLQLAVALVGTLPIILITFFLSIQCLTPFNCHNFRGWEIFYAVNAVVTVVVAIVLSFLSDILFIIVTRKILRLASLGTSLFFPIAILIANVALGAGLLVGAPAVASLINLGDFGLAPLLLAIYNVLDVAVALLFLPVAGFVLLDRAVWSVCSRVLENVEAERVLEHRGILITAAAGLIGFGGWVGLGRVFEYVAKLF